MKIDKGECFLVLNTYGILLVSDDNEMAAIDLSKDEARQLAEALLAYANTAENIMDDMGG